MIKHFHFFVDQVVMLLALGRRRSFILVQDRDCIVATQSGHHVQRGRVVDLFRSLWLYLEIVVCRAWLLAFALA